jgi:hypothetical protein
MAKAKGVLEEANQKPACIKVDLDLPDAEGNELLEQLDGILVLALIKDRSLQRQAEAMGEKKWNPRSQPKTPHAMMPLVAPGPRLRLVCQEIASTGCALSCRTPRRSSRWPNPMAP